MKLKGCYIKVPGTSANMGSGFDMMGLALKIYNEFDFRLTETGQFTASMAGGQELPFDEKDNFVKFAYLEYFRIFTKIDNPPAFHVRMKLNLPLKGGLGSSASAFAAGFALAVSVHRHNYSEIPLPGENEILYELAMLEGHPDNSTPAWTGGLVFSFIRDNRLEYYKKKFPGSVSLFVFIPDEQTSTAESRNVLPGEYHVQDVIFNMSRIASWYEFLEKRKPGLLQIALEDRLHTPYRVKGNLSEIIKAVKTRVIGCSLSGSGPALLLYVERKRAVLAGKNLSEIIDGIMKKSGTAYRFFKISPDNQGIQKKEIF